LVPDGQFEENETQREQDLWCPRVGDVCAKVLQGFADLASEEVEEFVVEEFGVDLADAEFGARAFAAFYRVPHRCEAAEWEGEEG
jgi:hypothetical protein